jgi:uncharacterized protein (TIGR03437 family)
MSTGLPHLVYNNTQVLRSWLALVVLCVGAARGAAPSYSAESIVNTPNYTLGPFAPGSIVTIFGSGLGESAQGITLDAGALHLPFELNNARVTVSNEPAALFYVSGSQINFLIPPDLLTGPVTIRVTLDGNATPGPEITVALVDAVPALFPMASGYAIAQHADGTLLTADSPAHSGDIVVIYLTGLGRTSNNPSRKGEIPQYAEQMLLLSDLKVWLGGTVMDPLLVKYAGVTPGFAGLYQINLELPGNLGTDPEIRVAVGGQSSPAGLKLPVR